MHQYFRGQETPWPAALGLSLAIHAGVLVLLGQTRWSRAVLKVQPEPLEVYLSHRLPVPASVETPAERSPARNAASEAEAAGVALERPGDVNTPSTADTESDSSGDRSGVTAAEQPAPVRRTIDWPAEARRAAVRMRGEQAQADADATFGNPFSEEAPTGLKSEEGQRPDERHLSPERSSFGEMITSLGGGCYLIHGGGSILVEQAFSMSDYKLVGRRECPRPVGPRDDLFREQKPEYLK